MFSRLNSFGDFLFENIDTTFFIISDQLFDVLMEINHPISSKLKSDAADQPKKKITYFNVVFNEYDKWSFVNSIKAIQYIEDKGKDNSLRSIHKYKGAIIDKYSSKSKIGRLINKLYPKKFTPAEIEEFVHLYKTYFATKFDFVDTVKGDNIKKWYDCTNYNTSHGDDTELIQSCMASSKKNEYMDFYAVNDDRVQMLILYSSEKKDKIDARGILWKPDTINGKENTEGRLFLDRIYYNKQEHRNTLRRYADLQGWYYKHNGIYDPKTKETESVSFALKNVKISPSHTFPYMDTLDYFLPDTNTLTNDTSDHKNYGILGSQSGDMEVLIWVESRKRFYHPSVLKNVIGVEGDELLPPEDVVWIPRYNQGFSKEYAEKQTLVKVQKPIDVKIHGDDAAYYDVFKSDVVKSGIDGKEYFDRDMVYSDFLDMYIPAYNAELVPNMDSYLPIEDLVLVTTDIRKIKVRPDTWDDYDYRGATEYRYKTITDEEFYHKDDPHKPFFKNRKDGKYYLKSIRSKLREYENEKN